MSFSDTAIRLQHVDPLSDEGIGRSFDLAGLMMGRSRLPSGSLVDQAGKTQPSPEDAKR